MLKDNLMGCYCNLLLLTQGFEYTAAIIVPVMVCTSIETNRLRPIIFILGVKSREIICHLGIVVCYKQNSHDLGAFVEFNFLSVRKNL